MDSLPARVGSLVRAIEDSDDARIEEAILRLSRSRRVFAPLAFAVGAFALLFDGLRLLVSNWRLTLVQDLIARAGGAGADIARSVKRADLADRARNPPVRAGGWSPPNDVGLEILRRGGPPADSMPAG